MLLLERKGDFIEEKKGGVLKELWMLLNRPLKLKRRSFTIVGQRINNQHSLREQ